MPNPIVIIKVTFQNISFTFLGIKFLFLNKNIILLIKYINKNGISINTKGLYLNAFFISNLNRLFNKRVVPQPGHNNPVK